ncbi:hypothetical protein KQI77_02260 [Clostridium sp. MSJ-8]|uniref:hypothetical protein n=1 Tax=Clostridium sp. MSJ-8 TaxID=2841510 RepID=UPI001C0F13C3|nr:hypothetical protein [Clostridium sp. MSJ-8]MBU5486987.1 hypothetical protein [Clostridium sp. MSJ-8]
MFLKILFITILIITVVLSFTFYCSTLGLLYYLADKHNDYLSSKKAQELTSMAMKKTIKEFFGEN